MPIGHLRTTTNMGSEGFKENDSWKTYTHETKPNDPITPEVVEPPKKKSKPKAKKEKAIEDAISKDLKKRNIHYPNDKSTSRAIPSPWRQETPTPESLHE